MKKTKVKYWPDLIETLKNRTKLDTNSYGKGQEYDKYIYQCPFCLDTRTSYRSGYDYVCIGTRMIHYSNVRGFRIYHSEQITHEPTATIYEKIPTKYKK